MQDLRYAFRSLLRRPWYSSTVVLVLTVGIALATVAFAVVDGVLFKPLPYQRSSELFVVHPRVTSAPRVQPPPVSLGEIQAWRQAVPALALTGMSAPERYYATPGRDVWSASVDERFFDVLGQRPLIGGFRPEHFEWSFGLVEDGGTWQPQIISYRLWRQEFGGDRDAIGRTFISSERNGRVFGRRIVGVLPRDFLFPLDTGGAQPDVLTPGLGGVDRRFHAVVRMAEPARLTQIAERLRAATQAWAATAPSSSHGAPTRPAVPLDDVRLTALSDHLASEERPAFRLVTAAAGLMLLLACLNVAGLAAASNLGRQRDLAVRRALGASGWQLSRPAVLEVGILSAAGTAAALLLARPLLIWTIALLPSTLTLMKAPALDGRVFVMMTLFTITTVLLVSLWPAGVAARVQPPSALNALGGSWTAIGRRSRSVLIGGQVGLGFVLLTAGGLSTASFAAAWRTDAGFDRERLILIEAFVARYSSPQDSVDQLTAAAEALARVPAVEDVAVSSIQTLFARRLTARSTLVPSGWTGQLDGVAARRVTDNFFSLMGMDLLRGRWPEAGEWTPEQPVAIVSATAARMLWPGRDAIGQILVRTPAPRQPEPPTIVIGVVADARYAALDADPIGDIYLPGPILRGTTGVYFHASTSGDARRVARDASAALTAAGLRLEQAVTHEDAMFAALKHRALPAWLFGSLGVSALLVLGAGILGLLAMSAVQRTRELGVRIALGATPYRVVGLFVREQLAAVGYGLAAGAGVSSLAVGYVESQLYGVRPYEPAVWSAIALTLVAVALAGTLVPALRAARVNPVEALRFE